MAHKKYIYYACLVITFELQRIVKRKFRISFLPYVLVRQWTLKPTALESAQPNRSVYKCILLITRLSLNIEFCANFLCVETIKYIIHRNTFSEREKKNLNMMLTQ